MSYIVDLKTLSKINFDQLNDLTTFIEHAREMNSINESKHTREWWTISSYAYYYIIDNKYSLPLSISRGSDPKPDFWISYGDDTNKVGIETTFCSEEKYEQAKKVCEAKNDGSYPINTNFMKNNVGNFDESFFQQPNQPLHGIAIYGDYSTKYTIDRIFKSISKKIEKYESFKQLYILAVYINLPSNIYLSDADKYYICQSLSLHKDWANTFTSIDILWSKENVNKLN